MALKSPNMASCNPKRRCLSGPNEGLAYAPEDPCASGFTFNELKCDCVQDTPLYGWVYADYESIGYCTQTDQNAEDRVCCSEQTLRTAGYISDWTSGPEPVVTWEASTSWDADGEKSGTVGLGGSITVAVQAGTAWTSDHTPWEAPHIFPAVASDPAGCSQTYISCGAVGSPGCRSSSKLTLKTFQYDPGTCDCSDLDLAGSLGRSACIRRCLGYA